MGATIAAVRPASLVLHVTGTFAFEGKLYNVEFSPGLIRLRCTTCERQWSVEFSGSPDGLRGAFAFQHDDSCHGRENGITKLGKISGTVARTFPHRGYCFINGDDGLNYFAHASHITTSGSLFDVREGQRCTFVATLDKRGPQAVNVEMVVVLPRTIRNAAGRMVLDEATSA